jgi:hypothetical protein
VQLGGAQLGVYVEVIEFGVLIRITIRQLTDHRPLESYAEPNLAANKLDNFREFR